MAEKSLYVLLGFERETEMCLWRMQEELYAAGFSGRQTKGLHPHVTLGEFPLDEETNRTEQLKQVARQFSSFQLTFNHVGIFDGGEVLFIAPDVSAELLAIKERFGSSFNWTPHVTMLIDAPSVISCAVPHLTKQFQAFAGWVNRISLYEFQPSRHILTLGLGGREEF